MSKTVELPPTIMANLVTYLEKYNFMRCKHASVLLKNGKTPVAWGINRTTTDATFHAEISAIDYYLRNVGFAGWAQRIKYILCPSSKKVGQGTDRYT
jgi:hypothetical protein